MPSVRAPTPRFPTPTDTYDSRNEAEFRSSVERALEEAIQFAAAPPEVKIEASRSGASATMTVTAVDYGRRITAIEFNKREGANAATGWVSTWDTATGTIGTDASLVRSEAISIPAGLDSSAEWRVTWRDQFGTVQTKGGPVPLSNLGSLNKTLRIPFTQLVPDRESGTWLYDSTGGHLEANSLNVEQIYVGSIVLPKGTTITAFRARMYRETGADVALATLYRNDDTSSADISDVLTHVTTAAWATPEDSSIGQVVGEQTYWVQVRLKGVLDGSDARVRWVEVDYTSPDYSKTY